MFWLGSVLARVSKARVSVMNINKVGRRKSCIIRVQVVKVVDVRNTTRDTASRGGHT